MYAPIETAALFVRLSQRPDLQAKALELRGRVTTYLRAVDASFSHFTSHAVDHSDEIVRELSAMLFSDPSDQGTISVDLNHTETYMLLLAIYLHDVGMVVTEKEKFEILNSQEWRQSSSGHQLVEDIEGLRMDLGASAGADQSLFVAALEQKLRLANFFRSRHADRARGAINGALRVVDDFLSSDPSAGSSITAICVGHGLGRNELASDSSYPTRRDHFGEPVNVRLLTVLVRIGDLLDMRSERACPLMYSIVSPLPSSSEAHWTQYKRIVSRVTSPSRIELRAECKNADEHRLLLDWCSWLADEVSAAPRLMSGEARHAGWVAPKASIGDSQDTIQILRAPGARYRAEDWKFKFDENEIVLRLVRDVHRGQFGFIRELLQNALDTTRARALLEAAPNDSKPELLPSDIRDKYPISIVLGADDTGIKSIAVSDLGLGMTPEIVKDYFLQIGRSWYRSAEFAREFSFSTTSRFGIGFLSVFAVSDDVVVDTRWHGDPKEKALSMKLPGPKNHLLFEDAIRNNPGTTVTVHLREPMQVQPLLRFLQGTCVANEFDVVVTSEPPGLLDERYPEDRAATADLQVEVGDVNLTLHRVCSSTDGVSGYFEFLKVVSETGEEDWSQTDNELEALVTKSNPLAEVPTLMPSWVALNGLSSMARTNWNLRSKSIRWEFDVRSHDSAGQAGLDRERPESSLPWGSGEFSTALNLHLENSTHAFPYAARLQRRFGDLELDWAQSVPILETLDGPLISMSQAKAGGVFLALNPRSAYRPARPEALLEEKHGLLDMLRQYEFHDREQPTIVLSGATGHIDRLNMDELATRLTGRIHELSPKQIVVEISPSIQSQSRNLKMLEGAPDSDLVRFSYGVGEAVLNTTHPFVSEILAIPDHHKAVRIRLFRALRSPTYDRDLASDVASVGAALKSPILLGYAQKLGRSSNTLTLPRTHS